MDRRKKPTRPKLAPQVRYSSLPFGNARGKRLAACLALTCWQDDQYRRSESWARLQRAARRGNSKRE
ncbi:MAG: hypothetical protein ABSF29_14805 [Tepidisphaeraceae bacterium]